MAAITPILKLITPLMVLWFLQQLSQIILDTARKNYKVTIYKYFSKFANQFKLIRRDASAGKIILAQWILEEIDEKVDILLAKIKNKEDVDQTDLRTHELEPTVKSVQQLILIIKKY